MDLPSGTMQPQSEFHIFKIHKKTVTQKSITLYGQTIDHQCGSGHPTHITGRFHPPGVHILSQTPPFQAPHEQIPESGESTVLKALILALFIHQAHAASPASGVMLHILPLPLNRSRTGKTIAVQQ